MLLSGVTGRKNAAAGGQGDGRALSVSAPFSHWEKNIVVKMGQTETQSQPLVFLTQDAHRILHLKALFLYRPLVCQFPCLSRGKQAFHLVAER